MIQRSRNLMRQNMVASGQLSEQGLQELCLVDTENNNLYKYLHETAEFSVDLSGSPLKTLMKSSPSYGDMFEYFYTHEADRKFILLNFVYSFLKDPNNRMFQILLIQGPNRLSYEEISVFLHEEYFKETYGKTPASYLERHTDDWLQRVISCSLVTKDEQKLNSLCLPFMIQQSRQIKAIIYADVNAFDIDYRAKSNQRLTTLLRETGLLVLSFKRDYHPGKDPIFQDSEESDGTKTCSSKVTKIVSMSTGKLSVRYLAPAETYKVRTTKKQDVFRSVMISETASDPNCLRLVIYSPYPFELRQQTLKKGYVEPGQTHFRNRSSTRQASQ